MFNASNKHYIKMRGNLISVDRMSQAPSMFMIMINVEKSKSLVTTICPIPPMEELPHILKSIVDVSYNGLKSIPDYIGVINCIYYAEQKETSPEEIYEVIKKDGLDDSFSRGYAFMAIDVVEGTLLTELLDEDYDTISENSYNLFDKDNIKSFPPIEFIVYPVILAFLDKKDSGEASDIEFPKVSALEYDRDSKQLSERPYDGFDLMLKEILSKLEGDDDEASSLGGTDDDSSVYPFSSN